MSMNSQAKASMKATMGRMLGGGVSGIGSSGGGGLPALKGSVKRASGGAVTGSPSPVRMDRASGGRVNKGKTTVNVIVSGGGAASPPAPMPMAPPPPMPPPEAAPPPMPPPGAGGGGGPPGPPAMMRKRGGRVYGGAVDPTASYGSGSGTGTVPTEGKGKGKDPSGAYGGKVPGDDPEVKPKDGHGPNSTYSGRKRGGGVNDDAGAGSGEGRLEKIGK